MDDRRAIPTSLITALLATVLVGCSAESLPRPRFPQVEQATETMQGGGERFRDHQVCMKQSLAVEELVQCMEAGHWRFVAHGGVYPEPECWEAREHGQLDRVAAHCFLRVAEQP